MASRKPRKHLFVLMVNSLQGSLTPCLTVKLHVLMSQSAGESGACCAAFSASSSARSMVGMVSQVLCKRALVSFAFVRGTASGWQSCCTPSSHRHAHHAQPSQPQICLMSMSMSEYTSYHFPSLVPWKALLHAHFLLIPDLWESYLW